MRELPSGTLTLLFTDIEGSTRLLNALGDRYPAVLADQRDLLRAAVAAHEGIEVDTQGDAFFIVFPRATQAVRAAVAAQRALAAHPWPAGGTVRVRMGLHTGEPQPTPEGYAGLDVHRAARIGAAGHGGQILVSEATAIHVRQTLPDGVQLRDLGDHRLKDLVQPEHLYQLDVWGLPVDFPPVRSLDSHPNNLPTPTTSFIGRDQETVQLVALLRQDDVRLVTLTGPGGSGKTRLAFRIGTELLHDFRDGVFVVELAPISDLALVVPTIAQALGVQETEERPVADGVTSFLRDRQLLLVLDNFEQVVEAARTVAALLVACPRLKVLVSSRAPLHLSGEREYPVLPLPLPNPTQHETLAQRSQYAAVRLFVDRAVAVRPDFAVTNENAPAVADICVRLDGLPLAIELAAAWVKLFTPQALLGRLAHRLQLLTGGARDLPARQQTLRNALAWSYDLLAASEQVLFRRLGVFVGGFTLAAAEVVGTADGELTVEVLAGLASLVDKSLLTQQSGPDGEPRFGMLETVREYARERLVASGEEEACGRQHAAFFLAQTQQHARRQADALLAADQDNVRAALAWWVERGDLESGARLVWAAQLVWFLQSDYYDLQQWPRRLLALPGAAAASRTRARLLTVSGFAAVCVGDFTAAQPLLEESVALSRAVADRFCLGVALAYLGYLLNYLDPAAARPLLEEGLALAQEYGDKSREVILLSYLAAALNELGEWERSRAVAERSLTLARELGTRPELHLGFEAMVVVAKRQGDWVMARTLTEERLRFSVATGVGDPYHVQALRRLAEILLHLGEVEPAADAAVQSLALEQRSSIKMSRWWGISLLGQVEVARGATRRAVWLLGAAEAARAPQGSMLSQYAEAAHVQAIAAARVMLGETAFTTAWAEGQAMTLEQVVAHVLEEASEA